MSYVQVRRDEYQLVCQMVGLYLSAARPEKTLFYGMTYLYAMRQFSNINLAI
jgi:hypothetical protein